MKNKRRVNPITCPAWVIALTSIIFLISCNKEDHQDDFILHAITEYQAFYEEQMFHHSTKGYRNIPNRIPRWEKSTIQDWHRGNAAVVQLDYQKEYSLRSSVSPYSMNLAKSSYLVINKNEDGSMQGEIVYLIPDGLARSSDTGGKFRFSGTILVENLHGEILAVYFCHPDGNVQQYDASEAVASSRKAYSKSQECFIYQFWQIVSGDGGQTWSEPILLSSETICFDIEMDHLNDSPTGEFYYTDFYEYIIEGGGGSPDSFRPLNQSELEELDSVMLTLLDDCATNNVVNSVWSSVGFNIDGSISTSAQYNAANNTITFQNISKIDEYNVIEEVFHAYQNTTYPGGIGMYSMDNPGFTNIEFEAKLFRDIYLYVNEVPGGMSGNTGMPPSYFDDYGNWVLSIATDGFTPALMAQYNTMLGYFNQYNVEYGGHLLPELDTPLAIIQSNSGCN